MIRTQTFAPSGMKNYSDAIRRASISDPLSLEPTGDPTKAFLLLNASGEPVGYLTGKHWLSCEILAGRQLLHLSVNGVAGPASQKLFPTLTVRAAIGDTGDRFEMPPVLTRSYKIGIVGESWHQQEIGLASVGESVELIHEPDNPHDDTAVSVVGAAGQKLGYLARDSWLKDVLLVEGKACRASIIAISPPTSDRPFASVALEVTF